MKRKVLAMLCALMMVAAVLAGCGGEKKETAAETGGTDHGFRGPALGDFK